MKILKANIVEFGIQQLFNKHEFTASLTLNEISNLFSYFRRHTHAHIHTQRELLTHCFRCRWRIAYGLKILWVSCEY